MGAELPALSREELGRRLHLLFPRVVLSPRVLSTLGAHYDELRRWNRRLSLIGPGTIPRVVERHYGESLAALPLLEGLSGSLVDVGSGGGFPGWVIAAARADLSVTLVEPRTRKWSFLRSASRRAGLPCICLDARVAIPLPEGLPSQVDIVTLRALGGVSEILEALRPRLAERVSILVWRGKQAVAWPEDFESRRRIPLPGSDDRWIEEARRVCRYDEREER